MRFFGDLELSELLLDGLKMRSLFHHQIQKRITVIQMLLIIFKIPRFFLSSFFLYLLQSLQGNSNVSVSLVYHGPQCHQPNHRTRLEGFGKPIL